MKLAERGELRLLAFCQACGHGARLGTRYAVRVIEGFTTVEAIADRLRCTKCRARDAEVRWGERHPRR